MRKGLRTRRKTIGEGTRTNNKLKPQVTPGPGIESGPQRCEPGKCSHQCTILASPLLYCSNNIVFLKVSNLLLCVKMIFTEHSSNDGKNYVTKKRTHPLETARCSQNYPCGFLICCTSLEHNECTFNCLLIFAFN